MDIVVDLRRLRRLAAAAHSGRPLRQTRATMQSHSKSKPLKAADLTPQESAQMQPVVKHGRR